MPYYAVIREHAQAWNASRSLREQEAWDEHAALMDSWVAEGFIVLGGPLAEGNPVLLIFNAENEEQIQERLNEDPWTPMGLLRTLSIQRWNILLGTERL